VGVYYLKTGHKPCRRRIKCHFCHILLPSYANFCSNCGKRVKQEQIGELESGTEHGSNGLQGQEAITLRLALLPQIQLNRWLSYQSQKNNARTSRSQGSNLPLRDVEELATCPFAASRERGVADTTQLSEVSNRVKPAPSSLTTSNPSKAKQREQTQVRSSLIWPVLIILSALVASVVYFVFTATIVRPVVVFWFLFICPGMTVVRFLNLKESIVEWTIALALSFSIDAMVAAIQLYMGKWSPGGTLRILVGFSLVGAIVQLAKIALHAVRLWYAEKDQG
jgi:hypothetical protein